MVDEQPWDPSIKALTAFPSVLSSFDRNLDWTTKLENAYYNQPQDVMSASFFAAKRNWHRIRTSMAKQRRGTHLIADIAKVSRGTVDRALHGRGGVNEATRQRILQIAREIGYRPNLAARALSANRATAKIGVCIPREIHFFYDQLWSGVLEEAERVSQFGVEFINRPVQNLGEGDAEAFKELMASGVDGIILTAGNPKNLTPLIDKAETKGVRVVCVDTDASESHRSSVVYVEPYLSGAVAGELLGSLFRQVRKWLSWREC